MKKKVIISVCILIVSMFWMLHFDFVANSARATISPSVNGNTLIFNIETLLNLIDWNHTDRYLNWFIPQNIALPLVAYQMGIITLTQLADWASTVSNTHSYPVPLVFVVYAELMKYGIENQSEIEWALDSATMMANGLPDTDAMIGLGSGYFATYGTSILWAYYWANKYTYDQSKWNLTKAYSSYKTAVWSAPYPAISKIDAYGNTSPGSSRYYDEAMLTLNAFLVFYQMGITDGLTQAVMCWNWINNGNNYWTGSYYAYRLGDSVYECEIGFFSQIAQKLLYYYPTLNYTDRIYTDLETRLIGNKWGSLQWTSQGGALIHANTNLQIRLENTLGAWAALNSLEFDFTNNDMTNIDSMLEGYSTYGPAWEILYENDSLYHSDTGLFAWASSANSDNVSSAWAVSLLFMEGIVPETGRLAMAPCDYGYEDTSSFYDADVFSLNVTARNVTISVATAGLIGFQYSGFVDYDFSQQGVYSIIFSSDWNSIASVTYDGALTGNTYRIFLAPISAIHDVAVTNVELSKTLVGQGFSAGINVTVANQGDFTETFNVTSFANATIIGSENLTLPAGNSTTVTFTWNTTGFAYANYTLSAYAWPVPGETDTTNNNCTGGWVAVSLVGDIAGPNGWPDGLVDMMDVGYIASRFLAEPGKPLWDPNADINGDLIIDMADIGLAAAHFLQQVP